METKRNAGTLKLLGGFLCLDFINTVDWRGTDNPVEFLNTFDDLAAWSRHVNLATPGEAQRLSSIASRSHPGAAKVLKRAVELRETIHRIFSAVIANKKPANKDLALFNRNLAESMRLSTIMRVRDGFIWDSDGDKRRLDWILNPIVRSAADLLVSEDLKKVKTCADPACGWLFLDVSRNRSRRWCDMQDCGNRAKARRFYKRSRSER